MKELLLYGAAIKDGWMYGRGSGDMKAGLILNVFALRALRALGWKPAADVYQQSVVEEECTGNGALACLQRGYRADAALIPEPSSGVLTVAQVGVMWFQVKVTGHPVHVYKADAGSNAIESAYRLIQQLHLTQDQAAARVGKSRSAVANFLRLRQLRREHMDLVHTHLYRKHMHELLCALVQLTSSPANPASSQMARFATWLHRDLFDDCDGSLLIAALLMAQSSSRNKSRDV